MAERMVEEPQVEVINPSSLMSSPCLVKDIDTMTIKEHELDFEVGK